DLAYTVIEHYSNGPSFWFHLRRQHKDKLVNAVLAQFIKSQRHKFSTDVEHVVEAVRCMGYQQLYINKIVGVPLFFSKKQQQLLPEFALCNFENKPVLDFWRSNGNQLKISGLFSKKRLEKMLQRQENGQETLVYCFSHIAKGKKYFYSATEEELTETGQADLFMQFGANKKQWSVYKIFLTPVADYQWHLPDTLPQHLVQRGELTIEENKQLLKLHDIELMAYIILISDEENKLKYQQRQPMNPSVAQLQQFCHPENVHSGLSLVETKVSTQRSEDRFNYQTRIIVHHKKKAYLGATVNFSVHGMQITMTRTVELDKGELLKIEMPLLAKASGKPEYAFLDYELMRVAQEGRVLNLRIITSPETAYGPKLIHKIISNYKHKLTAQVTPPANATKSLNLLYCSNIHCLPVVISKEGNSYNISHVINPRNDNRLFNLFSALSNNKKYCNVSAISKNNIFKELFFCTLKMLNANMSAVAREVYIEVTSDNNSETYHATTHYFESFESVDAHREFILKAKAAGQLFALRVMISRNHAMDYKTVSREIIYAAKQASYRTRHLQAQLDAVVGLGELIDITDEVMQRFDVYF
ncbi:MAG: PilZ domain-containing protein, partial [Psychrobium sp.]|nr:PilZ domain-containing protein [Psychrobium sp.]